MATKIKVKKITDLDKIYAQPKTVDGNAMDNNGILSGDQLIVAHKTNQNEEGAAVFHTTAIEANQLLEYIKRGLNEHFMQAEAGRQLSDLIQEKLKEAEDNMGKGNDVYSSNYYMDDSGNATFENFRKLDNNLSVSTSTEYVFKSTCMANIHMTIYNTSARSSTGFPQTQAYAKIQMLSKSGWKSICQQPVQCADGAFDIDLHGYFYAGTKVRGYIEVRAAHYIDIGMSNIQITRFSSNSGFEEKSFDWWVSNDGRLSSEISPPQPILSNGFLNFSGLYWSGRSTVPGSLTSDYLDKSKQLINHYSTDAVYANVKYETGGSFCLGNSSARSMYNKNSGVHDDFSGKYYYITPETSGSVSAYTRTDFQFKDDVSKSSNGHADSGGGWHNATLIKYVHFDEMSSVVGTELDEQNNLVQRKIYTYNELLSAFDLTAAANHKGYHRFLYQGGYGYAVSANVNTSNYQYMASHARNTARLYVYPEKDSAALYMRETLSGTNGTMSNHSVYSLTPAVTGGQDTLAIIRDDSSDKWTSAAKMYQPLNYTIDVLNENVDEIGVGRNGMDVLGIDLNSTKAYPTETNVKNYLTSEISTGYALSSVVLAEPPDGQSLTIRHFGFASCPRLESFAFPKNVAATGYYTFAAPDVAISFISTYTNQGVTINKNGKRSELTSVQFCQDPPTHIAGYSAADGDYPGKTLAMFSNCQNLRNINLQDTDIITLGSYTFYNCSALVSVEIPKTCVRLEKSVFQNCDSLSCVIFPSSLSSFQNPGKPGTRSPTEFTRNTKRLMDANSTNAAATGYKYNARAPQPEQLYAIDIKLQKSATDYGANLANLRENIFQEISALVNYLDTQGLGQTTATVWKMNSTDRTKVAGISTYGAGRRYFLRDKDGKYITVDGVSSDNRADDKALTFNTIATDSKVPVKNMIVPAYGDGSYTGQTAAEAYWIPQC